MRPVLPECNRLRRVDASLLMMHCNDIATGNDVGINGAKGTEPRRSRPVRRCDMVTGQQRVGQRRSSLDVLVARGPERGTRTVGRRAGRPAVSVSPHRCRAGRSPARRSTSSCWMTCVNRRRTPGRCDLTVDRFPCRGSALSPAIQPSTVRKACGPPEPTLTGRGGRVSGLVLVGPATDPRNATWPRLLRQLGRTAVHERLSEIPVHRIGNRGAVPQ